MKSCKNIFVYIGQLLYDKMPYLLYIYKLNWRMLYMRKKKRELLKEEYNSSVENDIQNEDEYETFDFTNYVDEEEDPDREIWYKCSGDYWGHPFFSNKGRFMSGQAAFSREQYGDMKEWKECVMYAMSKGYDQYDFCNPELSAKELKDIIDLYLENPDYDEPERSKFGDGLWSISYSLTNEQRRVCLVALAHKYNIAGVFKRYKLIKVEIVPPAVMWSMLFSYIMFGTDIYADLCASKDKAGRYLINLPSKVVKLYNKKKAKHPELRAKFDKSLYDMAVEVGIDIEP